MSPGPLSLAPLYRRRALAAATGPVPRLLDAAFAAALRSQAPRRRQANGGYWRLVGLRQVVGQPPRVALRWIARP